MTQTTMGMQMTINGNPYSNNGMTANLLTKQVSNKILENNENDSNIVIKEQMKKKL